MRAMFGTMLAGSLWIVGLPALAPPIATAQSVVVSAGVSGPTCVGVGWPIRRGPYRHFGPCVWGGHSNVGWFPCVPWCWPRPWGYYPGGYVFVGGGWGAVRVHWANVGGYSSVTYGGWPTVPWGCAAYPGGALAGPYGVRTMPAVFDAPISPVDLKLAELRAAGRTPADLVRGASDARSESEEAILAARRPAPRAPDDPPLVLGSQSRQD